LTSSATREYYWTNSWGTAFLWLVQVAACHGSRFPAGAENCASVSCYHLVLCTATGVRMLSCRDEIVVNLFSRNRENVYNRTLCLSLATIYRPLNRVLLS